MLDINACVHFHFEQLGFSMDGAHCGVPLLQPRIFISQSLRGSGLVCVLFLPSQVSTTHLLLPIVSFSQI